MRKTKLYCSTFLSQAVLQKLWVSLMHPHAMIGCLFSWRATGNKSSVFSCPTHILSSPSTAPGWGTHTRVSQCSGNPQWILTVPVRLYWNWKQFSLRRQGRTWESSPQVLEFSEGLSRCRDLLCIAWGSHDYESQEQADKDPEWVINYTVTCAHAGIEQVQGRDHSYSNEDVHIPENVTTCG